MLESRSALGAGSGDQAEHHAPLASSTKDIFLSPKLLGKRRATVYQAPPLGKRPALYQPIAFDGALRAGREAPEHGSRQAIPEPSTLTTNDL